MRRPRPSSSAPEARWSTARRDDCADITRGSIMPILRLADADIHYKVSGSGPAMLFIAATAWHGAPWELHQVPEFSRDHQVIVYDQRGTGSSSTRSKDFSTRRLAQDAVALLDHLRVERAIICGHSNGGR